MMSHQGQLKRALSDQNNLCTVCYLNVQKLYQISDCSHAFCQDCCIAYINSQTDNFSGAKCLQAGCNAPLNKSKQIYKKVSQKTKKKIEKHQLFLFVQKNTNFKLCTDQNCNGYFSKIELPNNVNNVAQYKYLICNVCSRNHCKKCYKQTHQNECIIQDDSNAMGSLNYKKCPKCQVWIQKAEGCDYIDCKCGCKFCYKCGNQFSKDPCRHGSVWKNNVQIRKILKKIKIKKPQTAGDVILFIPILLFQLILSILVTILFSSITLCILVIVYGLIIIFGPLSLIFLAVEETGWKRKVIIGCVIVFYPVLSCLFAILLGLITILFPLLRNTYHHGVYDPFDQGLSNMSFCYLAVMQKIWG